MKKKHRKKMHGGSLSGSLDGWGMMGKMKKGHMGPPGWGMGGKDHDEDDDMMGMHPPMQRPDLIDDN